MRRRFSFILLLAFFASCDDEEDFGIPKPRGYFRIDMPEKKYETWNAECPFTFEIPLYARMFKSAAPNAEPCWHDMFFPRFRATIYLSYKEIDSDTALRNLVNQNWILFEAHDKVASGMRDSTIIRPDAKVYGSVILLGGNAASQVQFYLTDSTRNFLRGSLYFYAIPNKDSLQPVLDFIREDIYHLAYTLKWKDSSPRILFTPPYPPPPIEMIAPEDPLLPTNPGGRDWESEDRN
jgi:gliding motility-associated lipoprotein GldD